MGKPTPFSGEDYPTHTVEVRIPHEWADKTVNINVPTPTGPHVFSTISLHLGQATCVMGRLVVLVGAEPYNEHYFAAQFLLPQGYRLRPAHQMDEEEGELSGLGFPDEGTSYLVLEEGEPEPLRPDKAIPYKGTSDDPK